MHGRRLAGSAGRACTCGLVLLAASAPVVRGDAAVEYDWAVPPEDVQRAGVQADQGAALSEAGPSRPGGLGTAALPAGDSGGRPPSVFAGIGYDREDVAGTFFGSVATPEGLGAADPRLPAAFTRPAWAPVGPSESEYLLKLASSDWIGPTSRER